MKKQFAELSSFLLIFIVGSLLLVVPTLGFTNINTLFFAIMIFHGLLSYILYMIIREKDDYEYLFTSLASVLAACGGIVFQNYNSQMVLSLSLIGWIAIVAIIKLIKMDYYHDRNNILWFIRTISFVLFLIVGTLTCVNLYYNIEIQSVMLGFFLIIVAILESLDPLVKIILSRRARKVLIAKEAKLEPIMVQENGIKDMKEEKTEIKKVSKPATKKTTPSKSKPTTRKSHTSKSTNTKKATKPKTTTSKTTSKPTTNKK